MIIDPQESLTLNTYRVNSVEFGARTELRDGALSVDLDEVTAAARSDPRVTPFRWNSSIPVSRPASRRSRTSSSLD